MISLKSVPVRFVIWIVLFTSLLAAAVLARSDRAFACDCALPESATLALRENAAVFSGKILAVKQSKWTGQYDEEYDAVLIEVDQIWKGIDQTQIVVYNPISSCQYDFKVGSSYLIYASAYGGELTVSSCSRTVEITQASSDLSELGAGRQPQQQINLYTSFHTSKWLSGGVITILAVVLILLPIMALVYRYRVKK